MSPEDPERQEAKVTLKQPAAMFPAPLAQE